MTLISPSRVIARPHTSQPIESGVSPLPPLPLYTCPPPSLKQLDELNGTVYKSLGLYCVVSVYINLVYRYPSPSARTNKIMRVCLSANQIAPLHAERTRSCFVSSGSACGIYAAINHLHTHLPTILQPTTAQDPTVQWHNCISINQPNNQTINQLTN